MYGPSRDPRTAWCDLARGSRSTGEKITCQLALSGAWITGPKQLSRLYPINTCKPKFSLRMERLFQDILNACLKNFSCQLKLRGINVRMVTINYPNLPDFA